MTNNHTRATIHGLAAALVSALALATGAIALAACGSSGSTTTSASSPAARRTQIADCLKKQGITPPQRPPGAPGGGRPGAGAGLFGFGGGGNTAPRTRFRTALRKCGITFNGRRRGALYSTPAGKQALSKFVACVRRNGYDLPAPNTSGSGPVFDPAKVNRNDPKFQTAARKCQQLLPRRPVGPPGGQGPSPGA